MLHQRTVVQMLTIVIFIFALSVTRTATPGQAQSTAFPQVTSIYADASASQHTHTTFVVQFTQAVTGVDISDFSVSTDIAGVMIRGVTATADQDVYHVVVSHGHQRGQILLVLADDDSIINAEGIPLGNNGLHNGNAVSDTVEVESGVASSASTPRVGGLDIGIENDMALTSSKKSRNIPVIAYYDKTNKILKLAICNNLVCNNPTLRTITNTVSANSTDWGRTPSIALIKGEIPVISYYDATNGDLWLTICKDALCKKYTSKRIDGVTDDVGAQSAIAVTDKGVPVISYSNYTDGDQMLAVCNSPACTSTTLTTIDQVNYGLGTDMKLSSKGLPVIVNYNRIYGYLTVTTCQNLPCTSKDQITLSGEDFTYPSLALTKDDIPVVGYYATGGELHVLHCLDSTCFSGFEITTIATGCICIPSIALSNNDTLSMSFYKDLTGYYETYLVKCDTLTCASPTTTLIPTVSGKDNDLAITDTGVPVISSYDAINYSLMLYFDLPALDDGTPQRFTKSSVKTTAQGSTATATLKWFAAPGATSYEHCVSESPSDCEDSLRWVNVGNTTTASVPFLPRSTTFFWQVRAVNAAGSTLSTGGFQSFVTK